MNEPATKVTCANLYEKVSTTPTWTRVRTILPQTASSRFSARTSHVPTERSNNRRLLGELIASVAFVHLLYAAENLYNGIVLPEPSPPYAADFPDDPVPPPFLTAPPAVIPLVARSTVS